ncbi:NAD(P)/FAD-dependent oxidoreductase [uncultured Bradyrhizobium sp.]|uniref:NAD(P)/FAD-dependent oxidoreductase n=1 Tax=uncultured Bradyrhizobium sp. TaxID=199684 RepID=UPI0035CA80E0
MMHDVLVAGAGPAGAVAATLLARRGLRVVLADGVDPARHKIGEHLAAAAVNLLHRLRIDFRPDRHVRVGGVLSSWGSDQLIAIDSINDPQGPGLLLDRTAFDAALRANAIAAGAEFRSANVVRVSRGAGWNALLRDGSAVSARWLVDATGRRALLAKHLGIARRRDARVAAVYRVGANDGPRLDRTMIEATPHGWWYAAHLPDGRSIAGFHLAIDDAPGFAKQPDAWSHALNETIHIRTRFPPARFATRLAPIEAGGACLARFSGEGWLACGDAALSFDPVSGQGMLAAIHHGALASDCIAEALDGETAALDEYSGRLDHLRKVYSRRHREVYLRERRWRSMPFWSSCIRPLEQIA